MSAASLTVHTWTARLFAWASEMKSGVTIVSPSNASGTWKGHVLSVEQHGQLAL